jgi:subtilisin family serine protease
MAIVALPSALRTPARWARVGACVLALLASGCGERVIAPTAASGPERILPLPAVPDQLILELAAGWTLASVNAQFGTATLATVGDGAFALLQLPPGETFEQLSAEMLLAGACTTCEPNYYVASPESEQGSIAFYEGDLTSSDLADQDAMARVRPPRGRGTKGGGATVAVLDTGIDATHPELAAVTRSDGFDFVDVDPDPSDVADGLDQDLDGVTDEGAGHGTHVAGIVHYLAPNALLLPVRVLDSEGNGTMFSVAQGVEHAMTAGADVINLSLAFDGGSAVAEYAIREAHQAGAVVVASAGNGGTVSATHFPADMPEVIGVAALDSADLKAGFSNYGTIVAVSAPGVGIVSTYLSQGYATWSGTSMAAPFVSGTAALVIRLQPGWSPDEARARVEDTAAAFSHFGKPYDGLMGAGRVDALAAVLTTDPFQP